MFGKLTLSLLYCYQRYIRIMLPSSCRYWPTCSEYTKQAVLKYGFLRGIFKGAKRILSCHPWSSKTGFDPLT